MKEEYWTGLAEVDEITKHLYNQPCSECKHLIIDVKETIELSKTNRRFDGDKELREIKAKCSKKNTKTVILEVGKIYNNTKNCWNSKRLPYEFN